MDLYPWIGALVYFSLILIIVAILLLSAKLLLDVPYQELNENLEVDDILNGHQNENGDLIMGNEDSADANLRFDF